MRRVLVFLALAASQAGAQCVMCQRTAAAQNAARVHVFNVGVLVLGIPPFLILTGIVLLAWKRSKVASQAVEEPVLARSN